MAVILLDPLLLACLVMLVAYIVSVWRGAFQRWYGRAEPWSALAWPLPMAIVLVPPVAAAAAAGLRLVGIDLGTTGEALMYVVLHAVPVVVLTVWPPRRLLPAWARSRLTRFPSSGSKGAPSAAWPAVYGHRGHGSRARWVWRVDGVAGFTWIDGDHLRFRATGGTESRSWVALREDDDAGLGTLRLEDGRMGLAPPRGGWWHGGDLAIALGEVDGLTPGARRLWARDGMLRIDVDGRRPLHLWVDGIESLLDELDVLRTGP